jgi:hypothetical protein
VRPKTLSFLGVVATALGIGCQPVTPPHGVYAITGGDPQKDVAVPDVGQAEWTVSRDRLFQMREALPHRPWAARIQVGVADPRNGNVFRARGAVAVSPEQAARLVLLGPAGTTALDVWVTRDRFRFAIPSVNVARRGGTDLESARGLPIAFLRWWLLAPLMGELVLARSSASESAFLLRDGPATVTVRTDGEHLVAVRREGEHLEGLEWASVGIGPKSGARGRYVDELGVRVQILIEEVLAEEPDPASLFDPDGEGTSL